ncbi:MAG: protein kinase [Verrucomicrobiota bacterium]|nr:protein kinase [Verrucomicrobiota bacterium]
MEHTTFFEHYRICTSEDESAQEVSRTGAAINYKAIDTRSHEPVRLQLIPLATIDPEKLAQLKERAETAEKLDHLNIAKTLAVGVEHDYFALLSEHFEGETADSWIVANGPMAADAALRVALQVVRAIGAAAFFNLTHRAIQPSNLMIVPGQSPDGGWPFVKLLNFGLAGLELHSDSAEASELAPTISPQFASPEQRANGEIDFRSEIYSLGATMCFLLTGAAPLAVSGMKARLRIKRLPELRRAPKPLHNLLVYLLRENPENRPQDPVALEKQMRDCLTKIERRQAIGRKLGLPLAAVVPRKSKQPKQPATPLAQVLRGFAAVAVLILAAAAAAEYFFPDKIPYFRRSEKIGVPVGVPDAAKFATTPSQATTAAPVAANQPAQNASPAIAAANESSPSVAQQDQSSKATGSNTVTSPTEIWKQIASAAKASEPASPGLGPSGPPSSSAPENSDQSSATESDQSNVSSKKKTVTSHRRSTSEDARTDRVLPYQENYDRGPTYQGRRHARVIGRTRDGREIVRLPSGRVVILAPVNDEETYAPRPRRRIFTERPDDFAPPSQPFSPND